MDLEDSFTEKVIQRSRARREFINIEKKEMSLVGKKRSALDEQQINSEEPSEDSPKRQCVQAQETVYSPHDKENIQMMDEVSNDTFVPFHSTSKVKGLAALKKTLNGADDSKLKEKSEHQVNTCQTYIFSTNTRDLCSSTKSRFTNLAADIRQWENDTHKPTLSSENVTSSNPSKFQQLIDAPNASAKSNTISMKLYYTNKPSTNLSHSATPNELVSVSGKGNTQKISDYNAGNIEDGTWASKSERLQRWHQAIEATLETPTNARYSPKPLTERSENKIKPVIENKLLSDLDENEYDDESINEADFAENYDEHKNYKMELDYSPIKPVQQSYPEKTWAKSEIVKKMSTPVIEEPSNTNVDPAELPLAARKALFEKALLGGSTKSNVDVVDQKLSVAQRAAMFENATKNNYASKQTPVFKEPKRIAFSNFSKFGKANKDQTAKSPVKSVQANSPIKESPVKKITPVPSASTQSPSKNVGNHSRTIPVPSASTQSPSKNIGNHSRTIPVPSASTQSPSQNIGNHTHTTPVPSASAQSPSKNVGNHTRIIQQKLIESSSNWQEKDIAKATEERKQEISNLVNHWEKLSSSSAENNNSEEKCHLASDEKYSDESNADDENSEYEEESVSDNVEESERRSESSNADSDVAENVFEKQDPETESMKSQEEDYDDEQDLQNEDVQSTTSQSTRNVMSSISFSGISSLSDDNNHSASRSQTYSSDSSARSSYEEQVCDVKDEIPVTSTESKNPDVPLVYTVSFYRKQKQETRLTPVRTIVRREKVSSPESPEADYTQVIQDRIKEFQEEILRQQTVISQTSQALNLCSATAEFSGSTEQVEGERLLLIATQKRQACLNEIQRLKTCGAQGENIADGTGTLIITGIQLPLKREFMASQLEGKGNDTVHYFLCLIRHGAQVIVTQMMSTNDKVSDGALCFTNHIKLQKLPADFSVVFEVYALQAKKEVLPHEKKYHIKRDHSKIRLTPKGKKQDAKILMPAVSSPGGPNAVRSPSFGVIGYSRFTLQNCNKHTFTLDKVPFTSPLDGVLRVKLQLHAEHKVVEKGFLTMFEDVSGFGAWHRRWCVLDVNHLAYWKYPDDEQKKDPISVIDLKQCVTGQVKLVSRDICARPHTFQLVTVRPQAKGDKNTLISRSINTLTTIKHLLSADTKEERILWCNKLNEALTNVRKWDPQALRPVEPMQEFV